MRSAKQEGASSEITPPLAPTFTLFGALTIPLANTIAAGAGGRNDPIGNLSPLKEQVEQLDLGCTQHIHVGGAEELAVKRRIVEIDVRGGSHAARRARI